MNFIDFRTKMEQALNDHSYSVPNPSKGTSATYFWVSSLADNRIGNDDCHYEFVIDEKYSSTYDADDSSEFRINLEIHFESEDTAIFISHFFPKLLCKKIEPRFQNVSSNQVGIVYKQFCSNDSKLIENCISALEEMDYRFQTEFLKS